MENQSCKLDIGSIRGDLRLAFVCICEIERDRETANQSISDWPIEFGKIDACKQLAPEDHVPVYPSVSAKYFVLKFNDNPTSSSQITRERLSPPLKGKAIDRNSMGHSPVNRSSCVLVNRYF